MNIEKAEQIAKDRMKEFFEPHSKEMQSLSNRMVLYSEKDGENWIVYLGLLPKDSQSYEDFKRSPDMNDSENMRAKDWLKVIVNSGTGKSEIEEVNLFQEII